MTAVVRRSTAVPAAPHEVWAVLARYGELAQWAVDVDHSCLLRDDDLGIGLVRRVQLGRTTLLETIDVLEAGRRLGYHITGLPPVLRTVRNEWTLDGDGDRTEVAITTRVDAGPRPPQQLVARLVAWRLARASDSMLAALTSHLYAHGGTPVA